MHVLAAEWDFGEVLWAMLVFFFSRLSAIFLPIWVVIDIFQGGSTSAETGPPRCRCSSSSSCR